MRKLKIHCLEHVAYEGLGSIEHWIEINQHSVTFTRFHKNQNLPLLNEIDVLIVMGGPMGIYDYEKFPYLKEEKRFIKQAIAQGKKVLGICLGAQLIADVLATKVYPNPQKEIGWFPVCKSEGNTILTGFEKEFTVFHWHGDTFELPQNAQRLFVSEGCENQGFLYKNNVLGLQFHLEVTEQTLKEMVENGQTELVPAKYIQSATTILNNKQYIKTNNLLLGYLLDDFLL